MTNITITKKNIILTRVVLGVLLGAFFLACDDTSTSSVGGVIPPIDNNNNINDKVADGVPVAPTNVQVIPGDGSMTVTWDAPTEVTGPASVAETAEEAPAEESKNPISKYTVYYSEKSITDKTASGVLSRTTTKTSVTIAGLKNDVEYFVIVTAHNARGEGVASSARRATPKTPEFTPLIDISQYGLLYNDLSVGEGKVGTVSPTWLQLPTRERLNYSISERPAQSTVGHVSIDRVTGVITTTTEIEYNDGGEYTISVEGQGAYTGTKTATLLITITELNVSKFDFTISKLVVEEGKTGSSQPPVWEGTGAPAAGDRDSVRYSITTRPNTAAREHVTIDPETGVISTTQGVDGNDQGTYTITALGTGDYKGSLEKEFTLVVAIDIANYSLSYDNQHIKVIISYDFSSGSVITTFQPPSFSRSPKWGTWNNVAPPTSKGTVTYKITKITPQNGSKKVVIDPNTGVISVKESFNIFNDFNYDKNNTDKYLTSTVYTITVTAREDVEQYVGTKTATFTMTSEWGWPED